MQLNQPKLDGVLQMQGNPAANHETPATGVATAAAPTGCNYATVWATVDTQIQVSAIRDHAGQITTNAFTIAWPANVLLDIPNVQPGTTTIEMTDI